MPDVNGTRARDGGLPATAYHKRLQLRRLWHAIQKHRGAQSLRKEIAFELRTARKQGAPPDQIHVLEMLLQEIDGEPAGSAAADDGDV